MTDTIHDHWLIATHVDAKTGRPIRGYVFGKYIDYSADGADLLRVDGVVNVPFRVVGQERANAMTEHQHVSDAVKAIYQSWHTEQTSSFEKTGGDDDD